MTSTATDSRRDELQTGIATIRLGHKYGSADFQALTQLEGRLLEAIDGSSTGLLIDLGETIYIGCELLNVLLRCHARATESHHRFALCKLNSLPEGVLAIARLDSLLEIFRTRRESLIAMQRPRAN